MNPTRTGKIARLPQSIRDEIGERLADGQSGPEILGWLNANILVRKVLQDSFAGRPVTEKNLSEWRQGGYQDWLQLRQTCELAARFFDQGKAVAETIGHQKTSEHLAALLAVEFGRVGQLMLREDMDPKQRWTCLCDIHRQLSRLRRDDHRATLSTIQRERWSRQVQAEEEASDKACEAEIRRQRILRHKLMSMVEHRAQLHGGGDIGHDIAAFILELENDLKYGALGRRSEKFALDPNDPSTAVLLGKRNRNFGPAAEATFGNPPTPAPGSVPVATEPGPTPATTSDASAPAPHPGPGTPDARPETQSGEAIPLANDLQPNVPTDEDQTPEPSRSAIPSRGASRCRPSRQPSGLAPAKSREFPVNVTKCNPSKNRPTPPMTPTNPPARIPES